MHFSRILSSLLVCISCFTLISPDPTGSTLALKLNQLLTHKHKEFIIAFHLIAASTGKNFFKIPQMPSEDCVRTAVVTLNLFEKPSTYVETRSVIHDAGSKCLQKLNNTSEHPAEVFCETLNDEFHNRASVFPRFDHLKKNVAPAKPIKDYCVEIQVDQSGELIANESMYDQLDDPAFLRFVSASSLLNLGLLEHSDPKTERLVVISSAIRQLSYLQAFESVVDSVFGELLEGYVQDLLTRARGSMALTLFNYDHGLEMNKMDEYFTNKSSLKDEYLRIKNETIVRLQQSRVPRS